MEQGWSHEDLVEQSPDAVWVTDLDATTVYANRAFRRLRDGLADDPVLDTADRTRLDEHRRRLLGDEAAPSELHVVLRDRPEAPIRVTVHQSLLRRAGAPTAVVRRLRPLDQHTAALEELRSSRAALQEAQELARLGSWVYDVASGEVSSLGGLLVPELGPVVRIEEVLGQLHPEDATRLRAFAGPGRAAAGEFDLDLRLARQDGWQDLRVRGVVHLDAAGAPLRVTGTHQDVTAVRRTEAALRDEIVQSALMRQVAAAANGAQTLAEVLSLVRPLLARHDDWIRSTAFRVDDAGTMVALDPDVRADEEALCRRALASPTPVWSTDGCTVAFPVTAGTRTFAVGTITASEPLERRDLIEVMIDSVAVQLARVAEREESAHALATARDDAMAASRQKSDFLATMSHEIRTPLNGILGLTDLLRRTSLDAEQQRLAEGMETAGRTLLAVLGDILDFSKLDGRPIELDLVDVDLCSLLDQVARVLSGAARANAVDVQVTCEPDVPAVVLSDPTRLSQVLMNLVSNAVKFSAGGEVDVRCAVTATRPDAVLLTFTVRDTGIGIEPSTLERLFEPFTQGDASTTRRSGGTGLGLAIARQIVAALGGEVTYRPNPDGGSIFAFSVWCERPAPQTSVARLRPPRRTERPSTGAVEPCVLVVEDNAVNQIVATGLLTSLGYRSEIAHHGGEALDRLARERFDAVLMDVQMPVLDGYVATHTLRAREAPGARIPVIAMTAAAIAGERERCLAAGMDEFLTKPVDRTALARVLDRLIVDRKDPMSNPPTPDPGSAALPPTGPMDGLDTERLDMLRDLDPGDTSYIDRAIGNFATNSRVAEATIADLVAAGDPTQLKSVAHKIAGSALNLGVNRAGEAARALELLADTGTTDGAEALLVELGAAMEEARVALSAYQATYSG